MLKLFAAQRRLTAGGLRAAPGGRLPGSGGRSVPPPGGGGPSRGAGTVRCVLRIIKLNKQWVKDEIQEIEIQQLVNNNNKPV
ncbi:hypothetical protein EYF80_050457 [Liparis tanakae]|uniref:Uncharacterized protein n=1 Tax=Liparis tanakae TaxID=230148 RepID=A0A4Z2FEG9_9TELE|nr:hypothetical protein EYF80_050457 [Liparis tanakae]